MNALSPRQQQVAASITRLANLQALPQCLRAVYRALRNMAPALLLLLMLMKMLTADAEADTKDEADATAAVKHPEI